MILLGDTSKPDECPKCGDAVWRDSADVGVGIIYGPAGCPSCGWSEDKQYDMSEGSSKANAEDSERWTDQFGVSHHKERVRENLQNLGIDLDPFNGDDPDETTE